ncbi:MAG: hypothetical protein ABI026_04125 [Gemmatimonadaceae bacterium]
MSRVFPLILLCLATLSGVRNRSVHGWAIESSGSVAHSTSPVMPLEVPLQAVAATVSTLLAPQSRPTDSGTGINHSAPLPATAHAPAWNTARGQAIAAHRLASRPAAVRGYQATGPPPATLMFAHSKSSARPA